MNRTHRQPVFALIMISITVFAVVLVCIQMVTVTVRIAGHGMENKAGTVLDDAEQKMTDGLKETCDRIADEVYASMLKERNPGGINTDRLGSGDRDVYYTRYIKAVTEHFGEGAETVRKLRESLPETDGVELRIGDAPAPEFIVDYDVIEGRLNKYEIKGVVICCLKDGKIIQEKHCDLEITPAEADFVTATVDISDYSIIAMEGIYITGETSTIVGNVYAGTHEYEDAREEEFQYGEKDPYGGINILSTRLGIYGNTLVTAGDLNIKGAFVIFGNEEEKISIYAQHLNETDSFPDETEYTLNGNLFLQSGGPEYSDSGYYNEVTALMNKGLEFLRTTDAYYSSDEDETYTGEYSKITSNKDVIIDSDHTGVVMTSGSIYIESGVNVEGLLVAGGRIYIKGNNNIVSNREITKELTGN